MAEEITEIFSGFQEFIDADQELNKEIRVIVKDLETKARSILVVLQSVHHADGLKNIIEVCESSRQKLRLIAPCFDVLESKVPTGQYYRFNDIWRFVMQRLSFVTAFIVYLETERLITREDCAELLGVQCDRLKGFHLELDDYLMGLLLLASELSRLAVNAVTACDYDVPLKIAKFLGALDSGFRLLNLKNDSLRKRYDGLKYDLKKVEEVIYDLSIRGLRPRDGSEQGSDLEWNRGSGASSRPSAGLGRPSGAPSRPSGAPSRPSEALSRPSAAPSRPSEGPSRPTEPASGPAESPSVASSKDSDE